VRWEEVLLQINNLNVIKDQLLCTSPLHPHSQLAHAKGLHSWKGLIDHVRHLPYGRTPDKLDFASVLKLDRGTCSTKHALLKVIADENNIDAQLTLCIYKMNHLNTPGIGQVIMDAGLPYVPEAHCYLKIKEGSIDITNSGSDLTRISEDIVDRQEINPAQIGDYKVWYHKAYLKKWRKESKLALSFEELWHLREACIAKLSTQ